MGNSNNYKDSSNDNTNENETESNEADAENNSPMAATSLKTQAFENSISKDNFYPQVKSVSKSIDTSFDLTNASDDDKNTSVDTNENINQTGNVQNYGILGLLVILLISIVLIL